MSFFPYPTGTPEGTPSAPPVLAPIAGVQAAPITGYAPLTVVLTDVSTGAIVARSWDPGDGGVIASGAAIVEYVYLTPGTYEAEVTVLNGAGTSSAIVEIEVLAVPETFEPALTFVPGLLIPGVSLTGLFRATLDADAELAALLRLELDTGDGTIYTSEPQLLWQVQHIYRQAGVYLAQFRLYDVNNQLADVATVEVTVEAPPVPLFQLFGTQVYVPPDPANKAAPFGWTTQATLTDLSSGPVTEVWLSWGDGTALQAVEPGSTTVHIYAPKAPGTYLVGLLATGPGGTVGISASFTVTGTAPPPVAGFSLAIIAAVPGVGVTVRLTNTSSGAPLASSLSVNWGDGQVQALAVGSTSVDHLYPVGGLYTVTLTVIGAGGSVSASSTITIPSLLQPPSAGFSYTPGTPTAAGVPVVFFLTFGGGLAATAVMNFGDGSPPQSVLGLASVGHLYPPESAAYTVTLTVTNAAGSSVSTVPISLNGPPAPPVVNFTLTAATVPSGIEVELENETTGNLSLMTVDWGDGSDVEPILTDETLVHIYTSVAASFVVTLTATGAGGTAQLTHTLVTAGLYPAPVAAMSTITTVSSGPSGTLVEVTDESTGFISGLTLNWGDGNVEVIAEGATRQHLYPALGGSYLVTLTATGPGGSSTTQQQVTISGTLLPPVVNFSVTPETDPDGIFVTVINASTGAITSGVIDWGDGSATESIGPTQTKTHLYTTIASSFLISVTETGPGGVSGAVQSFTTAGFYAAPSADLTGPAIISSGPGGTVVQATDASTGLITSRTISWGDGSAPQSIAALATASHTYTNLGGFFTVTLTAVGPGGTSSATGQITIPVTAPPPVAAGALTSLPFSPIGGLLVSLTNNSSGLITSSLVNWGDGSAPQPVAVGAVAQHTYLPLPSGVFTITLTVAGPGGVSVYQTTATVPQQAPQAVLSVAILSSSFTTGTLVRATIGSTGEITTHTLNMGDGTIYNVLGQSTKDHLYAPNNPGDFPVLLTAANAAGGSTATASVTVPTPPPPPPPSTTVPITVLNGAAAAMVDQLVCSTVSFARADNQLTTAGLGLLDAAGAAVPCQFRVLSRWHTKRDDAAGPIKNLGVWFSASAPAALSVDVPGTALYQLALSGASAGVGNVQLADTGAHFQVTIGGTSYKIKKNEFSLVDEVALGGQTVATAPTVGLDYASSVSARAVSGVVTTIEAGGLGVGNVRVVLKQEGSLGGVTYRARWTFNHNQPAVDISFTLMNPRSWTVSPTITGNLGLEAQAEFVLRQYLALQLTGVQSVVSANGTTALSAGQTYRLLQRTREQTHVGTAHGGYDRLWVAAEKKFTTQHYLAYKEGVTGAFTEHAASQYHGAVGVVGSLASLRLAADGFWERCPKSIEVEKDTGLVRFGLFPSDLPGVTAHPRLWAHRRNGNTNTVNSLGTSPVASLPNGHLPSGNNPAFAAPWVANDVAPLDYPEVTGPQSEALPATPAVPVVTPALSGGLVFNSVARTIKRLTGSWVASGYAVGCTFNVTLSEDVSNNKAAYKISAITTTDNPNDTLTVVQTVTTTTAAPDSTAVTTLVNSAVGFWTWVLAAGAVSGYWKLLGTPATQTTPNAVTHYMVEGGRWVTQRLRLLFAPTVPTAPELAAQAEGVRNPPLALQPAARARTCEMIGPELWREPIPTGQDFDVDRAEKFYRLLATSSHADLTPADGPGAGASGPTVARFGWPAFQESGCRPSGLPPRRMYGWDRYGDTFEQADGWTNGRYDVARGFLIGLLRTGDYRYWRVGRSHAEWYRDSGRMHSVVNSNYVGGSQSEVAANTSGSTQAPTGGHFWCFSTILQHLLTGDELARESLLFVLHWVLGVTDSDGRRPSLWTGSGGERNWGWAEQATAELYAAFGPLTMLDCPAPAAAGVSLSNSLLDEMRNGCQRYEDLMRGVIKQNGNNSNPPMNWIPNCAVTGVPDPALVSTAASYQIPPATGHVFAGRDYSGNGFVLNYAPPTWNGSVETPAGYTNHLYKPWMTGFCFVAFYKALRADPLFTTSATPSVAPTSAGTAVNQLSPDKLWLWYVPTVGAAVNTGSWVPRFLHLLETAKKIRDCIVDYSTQGWAVPNVMPNMGYQVGPAPRLAFALVQALALNLPYSFYFLEVKATLMLAGILAYSYDLFKGTAMADAIGADGDIARLQRLVRCYTRFHEGDAYPHFTGTINDNADEVVYNAAGNPVIPMTALSLHSVKAGGNFSKLMNEQQLRYGIVPSLAALVDFGALTP